MQTEIWRPVKGYEGLYEVSSLGYVKSLNYNNRGVEKVLKLNNVKGYLYVTLCRNGKHKLFLVHRLVAAAFIPNPEKLPEINHRDENKANNCVENLEWTSRWDNMHYGTLYKRTSKPVEASRFSDFREICLRFASTAEAGRNGYRQQNVSACCNGRYSTHRRNFYKNLYWRYADESENAIMQERQILIFMNIINNFKQKCLI